ncbi:hypothetical protein BC835DRAFT_377224 [Cytidiella melzeri]|nr:hypothetical protein BC835DRAFT_377224 [Cytidiella melzeri]
MLSSSPRTEDPLSPIFRHDYGCTSNAPRTPQRLRVYSSPSAFFEPNYEFAYPVDLCDPNTLQLSTPECLRTAMLEDDSPILRQGKQGRDIIPQAAAIHPPEEYLSDRDSESGLYASQSGSQSSISRSSSLCTSQKYGDVVSDDELPLAVTRSNLSFLTVKSQQIHPSSSSFKDRRILNNPSTALTGVRARAAQDQRAILPASPWSSPPSASAKENGAKGDIRQTTAVGPQFDTGSPLSSAPSSPGGDSVQKQRGVDSIFSTLGASPIGGRPTRAQIRALAEVLRPCQAGADTESRNNPLRRKRGREGLLSEPYEEKHEKGRKRMKVSPAIAMHMHTGNEENAETFSDCETQLYEEDENTGRNLSRRTFPSSIPVHPLLSALYRKFAVPKDKSSAASLPGAIKNIPRSPMDLYIPRWVKGRGTTKVGLCPICAEPPSRGGEGKKLWLSMKFSAFNYHMQYYHGISPSTGLPFSPPVAFHRIPNVPHSKQGIKVKQEKAEIEQGKCHKCKKWVAVEGVKDVEVKVKEIFWWKHAATCHQRSIIPGEEDVFIDDDVYRAARAAAEDDANQDANTEPAVDH